MGRADTRGERCPLTGARHGEEAAAGSRAKVGEGLALLLLPRGQCQGEPEQNPIRPPSLPPCLYPELLDPCSTAILGGLQ